MSTIFVSYRRADAQGEARLLYRDLVERFGKAAVFMDVTGITKGRDFRVVLNDQLATCRVALMVIGTDWLATDKDGKRRIDDPQDFVRLEVKTTLEKREIPVIPVLVGGATMPRAADLPDDVRDLVYRDGVELSHARWESDVAVLIKAIEPHLTPTAGPDVPAEVTGPSTSDAGKLVAPRRAAYLSVGLALAAGLSSLVYFNQGRLGSTPGHDPSINSSAVGATPAPSEPAAPAPTPPPGQPAIVKEAPVANLPSGPIVVGSSVAGGLFALDRSTEKLLWRKQGRYRCAEAYDSGHALVLDGKGIAVISRDGSVTRSLTNIDVKWVARASRYGDDALVLSSADQKWVRAVDWSGRELWRSEGFHSPGATMRFKGGVLVADGTAALKLLDESGKLTQQIRLKSWAISLASTSDGGVAVGVSGGVEKLHADGTPDWTHAGSGRVSSVQALPNGELLIADPDNARLLQLSDRGEIVREYKSEREVDCAVQLQ